MSMFAISETFPEGQRVRSLHRGAFVALGLDFSGSCCSLRPGSTATCCLIWSSSRGTFVADVGVLQTGVPDGRRRVQTPAGPAQTGESAFLRCQVDTFRAGAPGPRNCLQKTRDTTASNWPTAQPYRIQLLILRGRPTGPGEAVAARGGRPTALSPQAKPAPEGYNYPVSTSQQPSGAADRRSRPPTAASAPVQLPLPGAPTDRPPVPTPITGWAKPGATTAKLAQLDRNHPRKSCPGGESPGVNRLPAAKLGPNLTQT